VEVITVRATMDLDEVAEMVVRSEVDDGGGGGDERLGPNFFGGDLPDMGSVLGGQQPQQPQANPDMRQAYSQDLSHRYPHQNAGMLPVSGGHLPQHASSQQNYHPYARQRGQPSAGVVPMSGHLQQGAHQGYNQDMTRGYAHMQSVPDIDPLGVGSAGTSHGAPYRGPSPGMYNASSQGQQQQQHPSLSVQDMIMNIVRRQPLPPPRMIDEILASNPYTEPLKVPAFEDIEEFYRSSRRRDIAQCSIMLIGSSLHKSQEHRSTMGRILRLDQEYKKGLSNIGVNRTGQEKQVKTLQDMTLRVLRDIVGSDLMIKIQISYTIYLLKVALVELDASQRQRGTDRHKKTISLYCTLASAMKKAPRSQRFKVQSMAFKAFHAMFGPQTFEYIWNKVIILFIYLNEKEVQRKRQQGRGAEASALAAQMDAQAHRSTQARPKAGGKEGKAKKEVPNSDSSAKTSENNSNGGKQKGGRKRKNDASSASQQDDKSTIAKKQKPTADADAGQPKKSSGTASVAAAAKMMPVVDGNGKALENASFKEEGSKSAFASELCAKVSATASLYGLDLGSGVLSLLHEAVSVRLSDVLSRSRDALKSRSMPLARCVGQGEDAVRLTSEPKKDISAIYRRESMAAKAKADEERAALLREAETKVKRAAMDEESKEKLEKIRQEEDNKRMAKDANMATMSAFGDANAKKWAKWGSGGAKNGRKTNGNNNNNDTPANGTEVEQACPWESSEGMNRAANTITVDDVRMALLRDASYSKSQWMLQYLGVLEQK